MQLYFPAINDLSQLDAAQWLLFDGSYGVDTANSIAWSVNDIPDANYTVVARGIVSEPSTLPLLGAGLVGLAFSRRRKLVLQMSLLAKIVTCSARGRGAATAGT